MYRAGSGIWRVGAQGAQVWRSAAGGWWEVAGQTCVAAYQPKGAASLAASYVNLANPGTYDAAPGVAPTFDAATGWMFDGSDDYLTMGVAPSDECSIMVRFSDFSGTNMWLAAVYHAGTQRFGIVPQYINTNVLYANESTLIISGGKSNGTLGIAGRKAYRDGSQEAGDIATGSVPTGHIYIAARNRADTSSVDSFAACKIQALAYYSTTLSSSDMSGLHTRMSAL